MSKGDSGYKQIRRARRAAYRTIVDAVWRLGGIEAAQRTVNEVGRTVRCPACEGQRYATSIDMSSTQAVFVYALILGAQGATKAEVTLATLDSYLRLTDKPTPQHVTKFLLEAGIMEHPLPRAPHTKVPAAAKPSLLRAAGWHVWKPNRNPNTPPMPNFGEDRWVHPRDFRENGFASGSQNARMNMSYTLAGAWCAHVRETRDAS